MAKKELGYVELEWTCPNCSTKNPGPVKVCQACGAPQPVDVKFELKKDAELIKDEEKIAAAQKGPDIHCPFCGTRNPADASACSQCGGDLKSGVHRESGQVIGAYQVERPPVKEIACPNCATPNLETRSTCSACGALLQPLPAPATPTTAAASKTPPKLLVIVLAAMVILCLAAAVVYLISTSMKQANVEGVVQGVAWARQVAILEFGPVNRQTWRENVPGNARLGQCELRFNREQDQPAPVATEVCGTPYSKDTGSGYAEVVQDCKYSVYEEYCAYTVDEWRILTTVKSQGNDLNPAWPTYELADNQRTGDQLETYKIVFQTDRGDYTYTTQDAQLFANCQPGSQWLLTINGFGQLVGIQPK